MLGILTRHVKSRNVFGFNTYMAYKQSCYKRSKVLFIIWNFPQIHESFHASWCYNLPKFMKGRHNKANLAMHQSCISAGFITKCFPPNLWIPLFIYKYFYELLKSITALSNLCSLCFHFILMQFLCLVSFHKGALMFLNCTVENMMQIKEGFFKPRHGKNWKEDSRNTSSSHGLCCREYLSHISCSSRLARMETILSLLRVSLKSRGTLVLFDRNFFVFKNTIERLTDNRSSGCI